MRYDDTTVRIGNSISCDGHGLNIYLVCCRGNVSNVGHSVKDSSFFPSTREIRQISSCLRSV